jgi:hypothetical protein
VPHCGLGGVGFLPHQLPHLLEPLLLLHHGPPLRDLVTERLLLMDLASYLLGALVVVPWRFLVTFEETSPSSSYLKVSTPHLCSPPCLIVLSVEVV